MNRMRSTCVAGCHAFVLMLFVSTIAYAQQSEASRKALESAAAKGSAPAQYALGAAAEADGDVQAALDWYGKAALQNYAAAQFKAGELFEKNDKQADALFWYRKAAAQGFALATERLQALDPNAVASTTPPAVSASVEQPTTTAPAEPPTAVTPAIAEPPRSSLSIAVAPSVPVAPPAASPTPGTVTGFAPFDRLPRETQDTMLLIYIGVSTFFGWLLMRPIILRWYRSNTWFVSGRSGGEILGNQIQLRLQVEGLALTLGAVIGCLGGNLWFLLSRVTRLFIRRKHAASAEAEIA